MHTTIMHKLHYPYLRKQNVNTTYLSNMESRAYKCHKLSYVELNYLIHHKQLFVVNYSCYTSIETLLVENKILRMTLITHVWGICLLNQSLGKKQCGSIKLIQEINLDIKYIKAKENVVANALCRLPKKWKIMYQSIFLPRK